MNRNLFQEIVEINRDYLAGMEMFFCHECGKKIKLNTQKEKDRFFVSGMCAECEQDAIGARPDITYYLSEILEVLGKIKDTMEDLTKKEG